MAKRQLPRKDFLKGLTAGVGSVVLVFGLMGVDAATTHLAEKKKAESMEAAGSFTAGTYTGEGMGINPTVPVKVTMTFNESNVTDVEIDASGETPEIGGAAVDTLKEELLAAQSPEIDAVAEATVTSDAVKAAAQSCFDQASGLAGADASEDAAKEDAEEAQSHDNQADDSSEANEGEEETAITDEEQSETVQVTGDTEETEAVQAGEGEEEASQEPETENPQAEEDKEETAKAADPEEKEGSQTSVLRKEVPGMYTPGTYQALGKGIGHIGVTATIDDLGIADLVLDVSEETAEIGGVAAPELVEQILMAQSAQIDGVSGATETTKGVKSALQVILAQAGAKPEVGTEEVQEEPVTDEVQEEPVTDEVQEEPAAEKAASGYNSGEYRAYAKGMDILGVTLTIDENGKISDVLFDVEGETPEVGQAATETLKAEILEAQSAEIDAVAEATITSNAVKAAVENALFQAEIQE